MKKLTLAIVAVIIIIVIAYFASSRSDDTASELTPTDQAGAPVVILMGDDGFTPPEVTIPAGTTVTFTTEGAQPHWPASAMHPTHTVYPGSDVEKCDTAEAATIFDACRALEQGESWTFTFDEVGEWRYHDHLAPTLFGKVIVTP